MNSRARVLAALNHQEGDRIPFDVGGTAQSGIHLIAYANVRQWLRLPSTTGATENLNAQTARVDEDFLERLLVDTRFVGRRTPGKGPDMRDDGQYWSYADDWGIVWRMPKAGGLYYDMCEHPFNMDDVHKRLKAYSWPNPLDPNRFEGMRQRAMDARDKGKAVVLNGLCAGIVEMHCWLRGFERFYMDLASEPGTAEFFLDQVTELKASYWERALAEVGDLVDIANETDDLAGQKQLIMSPETYRRLVKPRHRELYSRIKRAAPHVKVFLHSCGAIRPLIPDLIDVGVDILNPVQISARDMHPSELKRDFGKDIVFWGGGVDTQHVLGNGTLQEVRENVKRNIDDLAPGGGFVFTPVHITQADVPPENFITMWETFQEHSVY